MPKVSSYSAVSSVASGDSIYIIQGGQSRKALMNVPMHFGGSITLGTDGSNAHIFNGSTRFITNSLTSFYIERVGEDKMLFSVGSGSYIDSFNNDLSSHTLIAFTGTIVELWAGPGLAGQGIALQAINNAANAVNYVQVGGGAAGNPVTIAAQGSDGNVGIFYATKGVGSHSFATNGGTQVSIVDVPSTVNSLQLSGSLTTDAVKVKATGADPNVGLALFYKGESNIEIWSQDASATLISVIGSESPISGSSRRYISFLGTGGAALNMLDIDVCDLLVRNSANVMLQVVGVAGGANWLRVEQSVAGNPVIVKSEGNDSTIALHLSGKGTSPTVVLSDLEVRGATAVPNTQSDHYTLVASDANKSIIHPASDNNPRTFTIPANASVAYKVGTMITFTNHSSSNVTIAINSDTMRLAVTGTTGSRTLAQHGVATALKIGAAEWIISGQGIT